MPLGTKCDVEWHSRCTEVASRAPHQFAWAGLSSSCRRKSALIILHYLHSAGGLCARECGYTGITFAIFMLGTRDDTIQSKTGASVLVCCVLLLIDTGELYSCAFEPDGDLRSLSQSVPGALQPRVDLPHLDDPFQPHHLQALVAYVCGVMTRSIQVRSDHRRGELKQLVGSPTLWDCFEKFRVRDDPVLLHLWWTVIFLGFTPEVGAAVHAGYVEDSYALQRHVAEVQGSPATLAGAEQKREEDILWTLERRLL